MARTYEPIASTTLGSAAAQINFTDIPTTYTDLVLMCSGNTTASGSGSQGLRIIVNTDASVIYSQTVLAGNGSAATSSGSLDVSRFEALVPQSSGSRGIVIATFMSYANTDLFKTCLIADSLPGSAVRRSVQLYRSTAAINAIRLALASSNLGAGYEASLYGIKAA